MAANITETPLFSVNLDPTAVIAGCVYSGLALLIFPIHFLVNISVLSSKVLRRNPLYILMLQINFCDFGQVVFHIISGLFPIFPELARRYQVFVRICGGTANSCWIAMFPVMCILSISRVVIIRSKSAVVATRLSPSLKILLIFGWTLSIAFWLTTVIGQNFTFVDIGWTYDETKPLTPILSQLEYYICFPILLISYIIYLLIIAHMIMIRQNSGTSRTREIGIFLQSTFMTVYICTLILLWHNADQWFDMTPTFSCILNCCWIFFSCLNPLLLLTLNRTVRNRVKEKLGLKIGSLSSQNVISTTTRISQGSSQIA